MFALKVRWVSRCAVVRCPRVGELLGECRDLGESGDELEVGSCKVLGQESVGTAVRSAAVAVARLAMASIVSS